MSRPLDILSTGRIYADLLFAGLDADPAPGREVYADRLVLAPGGGAFITAAYAASMGCPTGLFGLRPAPPFADVIVSGMTQAGVADQTMPAPDDHAPQITVAITGTHDRSFITHRPGSALPDMALPQAKHLHIGELATALENPDLITRAKEAGMTVSLDCGWDAAALADHSAAEIVSQADIFLPNEEEAEALANHGQRLAPRVALVIKRGKDGATAILGGQEYRAAAKPAPVVDATGAGDAFNAGFIVSWLRGDPMPQCLAAGVACGSEAISRLGGAVDLGRIEL